MVVIRYSGLSGYNYGLFVVGFSGFLMDLGMVNKLYNVERFGGGVVIMFKFLGVNMVFYVQDIIGGGVESGIFLQNFYDLGF